MRAKDDGRFELFEQPPVMLDFGRALDGAAM